MKKKNILIGLTLISALSFAQEKNLNDNSKLKQNYNAECNTKMMNRNDQKNPDEMMKRNDPNGPNEMMKRKPMRRINLPKDLKLKLDKKRITIQEFDLSVKKILLEEKVDWNKVQETNKKIGSLQAEIRTSLQKFKHEKKEKKEKK